MARKATGNIYWNAANKPYVRVRLGDKVRPNIALPEAMTKAQCVSRAEVIGACAAKLRSAQVKTEIAIALLERAAQADEKALRDVKAAVEKIARGEVRERAGAAQSPVVGSTISKEVSVQQFGELWTSGRLASMYPDHVRAKRSVRTDESRMSTHVYPIVGQIRAASFSLDDAEVVMRSLPPRSTATRRHVAQLMHRLLGLAVFPCRIRESNPLPKGFLPKLDAGKAKGALYPDEDARLLACADVPLCWRMVYGWMAREGSRLSEAALLTFADVDLERGAVRLDENKTSDARAWAISPDVVRALRAWRTLRGNPARTALVFVNEDGGPIDVDHAAARFRAHLQRAGVDRPELFEQSARRQQIRAHDMRATFITIALATGRSETWVADRTGHKSSVMINRYRRAARTFAELGLGGLASMDEAIPELRRLGAAPGAGGGEETAGEQLDVVDPSTWPRGGTVDAVDLKTAIAPRSNIETHQSPAKNESLTTDRYASGGACAQSEAASAQSPDAGGSEAGQGDEPPLSCSAEHETGCFRPRVPEHHSVAAGRLIEEGLRVVTGAMVVADQEAAVLRLLGEAYDLLELGVPATDLSLTAGGAS